MFSYILDRLKEPSSYAGLAAVIAGFGLLGLSTEAVNSIFGAVAAVAGAISIILKERSAK